MSTQSDFRPVSQRFVFDKSTRDCIKQMIPNFGFNGLGEVVFRRTYSRDNENWNDVVIRVIEGVMSLRKEHFHRNSLRWEDKDWQKFARDMAISMFNMEWLPPGRGLWMMGTEFVYTRGGMALFNCFTKDTTFWTTLGLKSFADFQDGDKVIIRGKEKWMPATVKLFGLAKIWELEVGRKGQRQTIFTTQNHRWLAKTKKGDGNYNFKIKTTDELEVGWKLQKFSKRTNFQNLGLCPVGLQHGIVFGDGTYNKSANTCTICLCDKKKPLSRFFFTERRDNHTISGLPNSWKELPPLTMNKDYLYGFMAGLFATDGHIDDKSNMSISNSNFEVLCWCRSALFTLDILTSKITKSREYSPFTGEEQPCYRMHIFRHNIPDNFFIREDQKERFQKSKEDPFWRVTKVTETDREEPVWCVVEPENEEFTLESGIVTKNCAATDTKHDLVLSAEWTMDCLMNGVGVGFSTHWRGEAKAPDKSDSFIYVIQDSREGWVESLIKLLCAYINSPRYGTNKFPSFDYSQIRPAGRQIKGFGGRASGPEPLAKMHKRIEEYLDNFCKGFIITDNTQKPYNHTRLIADIFNSIGACVVAGNVRRCLPGNSMVFVQGGMMPIKDVQVGHQVLTPEGYQTILNKFIQGKQKLIKIITQDGDFKCTPNHRMAVCSSYKNLIWKEAQHLESGDRLLTSRCQLDGTNTTDTAIPDFPTIKIDNDLAWFLGFFHYNSDIIGADIFISANTPRKAQKLYDQLKRIDPTLELFFKNTNTFLPFSSFHESTLDKSIPLEISYTSKTLSDYFVKLFTDGIPTFVKNLSVDLRLAYLAGIADATMSTENNCVINTADEQFARDVQNLLYSCGIESRLKCSEIENTVHLITKRSQRIFSEISQLQKQIRPVKLPNTNGFPRKFEHDIQRLAKYNLYKNQLDIDSYDTEYGETWFTPTEVIEITVCEDEEDTFDIEVENNHQFFCNGYLTHNSAEICLGDVSDETFINLKNYTLNPERAEIGWMSNNSVVLKAGYDFQNFNHIPEIAARIRDNGEPGMINLYNIQKFGRYGKELPDSANLVNPCFSPDTMIAVADGRGCVRIEDLCKEGKDVPVYSMDPVSKKISIQWGRNPRITGRNQKLLRIHFTDKTYMDVTPNHKFFLNDERDVEARDLKSGDSIPPFKKNQNGTDDYVVVWCGEKRKVEHRMIKQFYDKAGFDEKFQAGKVNGCCSTNGLVVHHKDEDKSNNNPDNLEIMSFEDHNTHHNEDFVGSGNPMYGKTHKESTKQLIGQKAKERYQDPEYRQKMIEAKNKPEVLKKCSINMTHQKAIWDMERYDEHEKEAERVGLKVERPSPLEFYVVRVCENDKCGEEFRVEWAKREQAYCSKSCANTKQENIAKRREGQSKTFEGKAKENFHKQAMIYKDLEAKGTVMKKDWENACKEQGVSCRFNRSSSNKWIAAGWTEFKQMVIDYNHRVSHIEELSGKHTVYNITVDNNHTLAVVTKSENRNLNLSGVFTRNCGEINLCNMELCNLAEVFPPRCENPDRFNQAIEFATFYASTVTLLPTHRSESNAIMAKNRRIGVSISGVAQWANSCMASWGQMNYTRMTKYLREGYKLVRKINKDLADEAGIPPSIRVTTIKPSGSISLLAGVTPGVHYPVSRYAIRRMRIGKDSPLVQPMIDAGIPHETDTYSDNTLVFEFVIDHGDVRPCEQVSPWEQFSLVAALQRCWADNSVSATIYFDKEKDGPDIEKLLAMYIPVLKSVSMLPHSGHGYAQAPYEPIDNAVYEARKHSYRLPDFDNVLGNVPEGSKYCAGDLCER